MPSFRVLPTTMPPSIDHLGFPHIVESILCETDWDTLLAARLVSASMCNFVDTLLPLERLTLSTSEAGEVCAHAWVPSERIKPRRALPFFCPGGSQASQHIAVHRADVLFVNAQLATKRLNELLQHIKPSCRVIVELHGPLAVNIKIPRCSVLHVHVEPRCACNTLGLGKGRFSHAATNVRLHLATSRFVDPAKFWSLPPVKRQCPVILGVLNAGVKHLTIRGNKSVLAMLLRKSNVKTHPGLKVKLVGKERLNMLTEFTLPREVAHCLKISLLQVEWELE